MRHYTNLHRGLVHYELVWSYIRQYLFRRPVDNLGDDYRQDNNHLQYDHSTNADDARFRKWIYYGTNHLGGFAASRVCIHSYGLRLVTERDGECGGINGIDVRVVLCKPGAGGEYIHRFDYVFPREPDCIPVIKRLGQPGKNAPGNPNVGHELYMAGDCRHIVY